MISFIIPTLNEVQNVPLVISLIKSAKEEADFKYEIIFVDDKSTDGTQEQIIDYKSKGTPITLIISEQRQGLGNALKLGMEAAQGDYILFLDCDVSIDYKDLSRIITNSSPQKMLIGSRYVSGGKTIGAPPIKVFLSKCLNFFVSWYLGIGIIDISHSLRIFPRGVLKYPVSNTHPAFFWELSLIAKLGQMNRAEIPITFRERTYGQSKNTTVKMIKSVLSGIKKVVELKRNIK